MVTCGSSLTRHASARASARASAHASASPNMLRTWDSVWFLSSELTLSRYIYDSVVSEDA